MRFPLTLRIPRWCENPAVSVNGKPVKLPRPARGWAIIERRWHSGDEVRLELPMKIGLRYYFNRRIDTMPLFLNAALGITPLGYHFDLGGGNQNGMMSTGILLNIGMGVRL